MATRRKTTVADAKTSVNDSFQNLAARVGQGTGNLQDASTYIQNNLLTREPRKLEFMYRGSWVCRAVVDCVADDMTRQGIDFGSSIPPKEIEEIASAINDMQFWFQINETIKWGRLYGGAIGVMQIDGQDLSTPLQADRIAQGQFKGVLPLGRWELLPNVQDLVTDLGPYIGKPRIYVVGPNAPAMRNEKIHYTRIIRVDGARIPYFQRVAEALWSLSVLEPMYDRLVAFDSTTLGTAQLVYKAYLRTLKVDGLRDILATGGKAMEALARNVEAIRKFQTTEGLTLIDSKDELEVLTYSFGGLDSVLTSMGQQISGATGIPLVRLFGQSPSGLNSTGESDIRNYYDNIKTQQESTLRPPLTVFLDVIYRSVIGKPPPEEFNFTFNPLWQLMEKEKADIANTVTQAVTGAFDTGIIDKRIALQELKQSADTTGIYSNITEEDIEAADAGSPGDFTALGDPNMGLDEIKALGGAGEQLDEPSLPFRPRIVGGRMAGGIAPEGGEQRPTQPR